MFKVFVNKIIKFTNNNNNNNNKVLEKKVYIYIYIYIYTGESNGNLPLIICPGFSVPEPYRSPDWVLVPAKTGLRAEY